jgi:hypothetical protein
VGYLIGALVLTRVLKPATRDRVLAPLAVLGPAALIPAAVVSPAYVMVLLLISGAGASFATPLNAAFARRTDPALRARAMGVAISGLLAAQGLGFLAAGAAVEAGLSPARTVSLSGLIGTAVVAVCALRWHLSHVKARLHPLW